MAHMRRKRTRRRSQRASQHGHLNDSFCDALRPPLPFPVQTELRLHAEVASALTERDAAVNEARNALNEARAVLL